MTHKTFLTIFTIGAMFLSLPALANDDDETASFPIGNNRALMLHKTESYAWSNGYTAEVRYKNGTTEPLSVDEYNSDTRKIEKSRNTILQSSEIPELKKGLISTDYRIGPDEMCNEDYKIVSTPAGNGSMSHHLILLHEKCYTGLTSDEKSKTTANYTRK